MSDDDVTERARQIVTGAMFGLTTPMMVDAIVSALADAGLLVSPGHDAAVAAKALREVADEVGQMLADDSGCELNAEMLASMRDPKHLMAWLRVRASEREGGAS